ncbi:microfibril-associated glycoprotein 4-like [Mercenaria mercenaria]|uniref:microfibril-associated glycoprotein 4-like n=1 Tax=Mercenaria mercenaria TaxID=6596 RepID=UPI00234FA5E7|nr:microfibril-associated glycoprotein 4-like [Mercenaria mercenaria]
MELKDLTLVLAILCVTTDAIDHYTVVNIHNGYNKRKAIEKDYTTTIIQGNHPFDLIGNLTSNLDAYETRFENLVDKLENVTVKLDICEAKLDQILRSIDGNARPRDCNEVQNLGYTRTGVYTIYPKPGVKGFQVRCDMDTTTGGWTVIQRRVSPSNFFRTWDEYKSGFGDANENYWLGNQAIHMITFQGKYKLRVDLTSFENETAYAEYGSFSVGDSKSNYTLVVGGYTGNAGDSLSELNHRMFSTKDRDNDKWANNCAQSFTGAWWYKDCHLSNLNGDYGNKNFGKGINWYTWKGHYTSLKITEMKILPTNE